MTAERVSRFLRRVTARDRFWRVQTSPVAAGMGLHQGGQPGLLRTEHIWNHEDCNGITRCKHLAILSCSRSLQGANMMKSICHHVKSSVCSLQTSCLHLGYQQSCCNRLVCRRIAVEGRRSDCRNQPALPDPVMMLTSIGRADTHRRCRSGLPGFEHASTEHFPKSAAAGQASICRSQAPRVAGRHTGSNHLTRLGHCNHAAV